MTFYVYKTGINERVEHRIPPRTQHEKANQESACSACPAGEGNGRGRGEGKRDEDGDVEGERGGDGEMEWKRGGDGEV